MFLRNAWYAAEVSACVGREPAAVRLLDEPIVLFRREDGTPAALEDACPHRKLPLSRGRLRADELECGYHGLRFNGGGRCTWAPANRDRSGISVRSYPAVDRYGLLWLWMGDAAAADPTRIIHIENWDDPTVGRTAPDSMLVACNYLYITDNLLDPTHVAWVHPTSFGDDNCRRSELDNRATPDGMIVSRWMFDTPVAPFYRRFVRFEGHADRQQHYEVRFPSQSLTKAIFTPAGTGGPNRTLPESAFVMDSYGFITPVDATHSRYFFFQTRNFAPGDAEISAAFAQAVRCAFEEDREILEAVQEGMSSKRTPNIDLGSDAGPTRFRRRLKQLISAESATVTAVAEGARADDE